MDVLVERALLVGVHAQTDEHFEYSLEELGNLAEAIEVEVVGTITQNLERPNPSHYVGAGKIEEIRNFYEESGANLVIFNDELSPSQIRNLENGLECKVIDRTMLILDIFARRARTREARMQVDLAQLQYMLPRLVGLRASLSRQGGGTGGGFQNKGAGETKLELDRRVIEDQIAKLRRELENVQGQRETQRKQRRRSGLPVVSLVGYTNAGKSTLMNGLLKKVNAELDRQVFEKDMLFATLDTSIRHVKLPDNKAFLLTDTVGFVGKLPHHLVKAFRSTLEEARDADLLLQVVDVSHSEHPFMMEVTSETLTDVGVENVPTINVFNKSDLADLSYPKVEGNNVWLSAKDEKGLEELVELIKDFIFDEYVTCKLLVPFDRGDVVSYLNDKANIKETTYEEDGTLMIVELLADDRKKFEEFVISY
ncbi:GTPase HflX [Sporosarcina pasteurii]|uniref:GTPase HflX n=1 Tax=Sporosarcina pasteurii TaxID=1474 RepID=A0A380CHA6_SPOPA|nr:GTPase HflX [Sporosarcina pasteurii]MDS9472111.1 GTPase HflX [Sporosarcina pasteurii]QBQ06828.1 GTPase HflX [Sporosarcina pasteurii]SUJ20760.1 GTP-binding protein HflX [Sporosarcina pasteurii]